MQRCAVPAGGTVRVRGLRGLHFVLVVGPDAASAAWEAAVRAAGHPAARHCLTADDLARLAAAGRLHVRPPAGGPVFLVTQDGWPVDWVAPPPGAPATVSAVAALLAPYLRADA